MKASLADRAVMDSKIARIAAVSQLSDLDDTFSIVELDITDQKKQAADGQRNRHQHTSLKLSCPTQWNPTLVMIESIVNMHSEVQNSLKKIGHAELCLYATELDMLKDLMKFLKEFKSLTELVSSNGPNLSLVSRMELKIRRLCKIYATDDDWLKEIKRKVAANVGKRLSSNDAASIQRILDPDTKRLIDKETSVGLLKEAVKKCYDRGIRTTAGTEGKAIYAWTHILHYCM